MLFSTSHGTHPFTERSKFKTFKLSENIPSFRYYFPDADEIPHDGETIGKLDNLSAQMVQQVLPQEEENSSIAPVFTYFGQFIDHDITAGTDSNPAIGDSTAEDIMPLPRPDVVENIANLRSGKLDLDSLYGGVVNPGSFAARLVKLMRHPRFPGKMRIARAEEVMGQDGQPATVEKPMDGASDLLRLGRLIDDGVTEQELQTLNDEQLRKLFFIVSDDGGERLNKHRAIIGDGRNDENLFVAQFHLALLRFHNKVVDSCTDTAVIEAGSDSLFAWAQKQVRHHYQWLVLNVYLKQVCDPSIVDEVLANSAPLYTQFYKEGAADGDRLPLPLEFSTAAFRFGHSMVRNSYDWNVFFDNADFSLLFQFTGGVKNPMFGVTDQNLPSNWPADWSRLATTSTGHPNRATRKIDTFLSPNLGALPDDPSQSVPRKIPNLASLNLRKSHLLNIPSAQACIAGIQANIGVQLKPLTFSELTSGPIGQAISEADVTSSTPLWLYILKEAEIRSGGEHLGPLGSYLVADTIAGLVINDPNSYWHAVGSDGGKWHPQDGAQPAGEPVTSIETLLRASLLL